MGHQRTRIREEEVDLLSLHDHPQHNIMLNVNEPPYKLPISIPLSLVLLLLGRSPTHPLSPLSRPYCVIHPTRKTARAKTSLDANQSREEKEPRRGRLLFEAPPMHPESDFMQKKQLSNKKHNPGGDGRSVCRSARSE